MRSSAEIWCLLLLFIALFTACEQGAEHSGNTEPVELSFKLLKDSAYRYTIKNDITVSQEIDEENSITVEQNMTLATGLKVIEVREKSRTISVTYERITMSSGNAAFSIDYDSENDNGTDIIYEDLRNLIDKTFRMTVSEKGDVLSSEPVIRAQHEEQRAYNIDDSSIRRIILHALEVYPEGAVQKGDVWERTYSTSIGFANVRVRNKYRLISIGSEIASIELQGRLSSENTEQAQGSDMNVEGLQSGTFTIDINTGLVVSGSIKQLLNGNMNITGASTPVNVESDIYIMGAVKH